MRKILLIALLAAFAMPILGKVLGPTAATAACLNTNSYSAEDNQGEDDICQGNEK